MQIKRVIFKLSFSFLSFDFFLFKPFFKKNKF
nr:MAG TPA: hypothetical protein [Caudoviricetes sp.]